MGFIFPKCLPGAMERDNGVLGGVLGEFFAKFLVKLLVVFLVLFLLYLIWAGLLVWLTSKFYCVGKRLGVMLVVTLEFYVELKWLIFASVMK